eukprot:3066137-Alexandrium_andersonii.AAC.1
MACLFVILQWARVRASASLCACVRTRAWACTCGGTPTSKKQHAGMHAFKEYVLNTVREPVNERPWVAA